MREWKSHLQDHPFKTFLKLLLKRYAPSTSDRVSRAGWTIIVCFAILSNNSGRAVWVGTKTFALISSTIRVTSSPVAGSEACDWVRGMLKCWSKLNVFIYQMTVGKTFQA